MKPFDEITVSIFKPFKRGNKWYPGTRPVLINLSKALKTDWQPLLTAKIKAEPDKIKRDLLKLGLYCITPSAITSNGRKDEHVSVHSGLMQFDIDNLKHNELERCRIIVEGIPYVCYLAVSASGRGLWGLVKINHPNSHTEHYNALNKLFKSLSIDIDTAPRSINSLRYLSYDENAYYNERSKLFELKLSQKDLRQKIKSVSSPNSNFYKNDDNNLIKWFNSHCNADYITEILENFGFSYHSNNGSNHRYTRPGKDVTAGLSVDYHETRNTLYSFSSSVPGLEYWKKEKNSGWSCSPVTALLLYGCGGKEKKHWRLAFDYIKEKM